MRRAMDGPAVESGSPEVKTMDVDMSTTIHIGPYQILESFIVTFTQGDTQSQDKLFRSV